MASQLDTKLTQIWMRWGRKLLPFADAASEDLPLSRLLRLSLIQFSVGISLTLLVGTLNRVMIVELGVSASIVGIMLALPLLIAPFRALIGHRSDTYVSALGWRRVPFVFKGSMLQFGGLAIMPFALLVLGGEMQSALLPAWFGQLSAAIAILLVGAGVHMTQTVGLALATDLAREDQQANIVGLMYVGLLVGSITAALGFGAFLAEYTPGRLIQVIQFCAVVTLALNFIAVWKQEPMRSPHLMKEAPATAPTFEQSWTTFAARPQAMRRLIVIAIGTLAFTMSDVVLEPYGGQVLGMAVGATTTLTALLAGGTLTGFAAASLFLSRGGNAASMSALGAVVGLPGFALVIAAAPLASTPMFCAGIVLIGAGAGLFGHGTLTATMQSAPRGQIGMTLGAWGAVQATAAGVGAALGGALRDIGLSLPLSNLWPQAANGYVLVYLLEVALLGAALAVLRPMIRHSRKAL